MLIPNLSLTRRSKNLILPARIYVRMYVKRREVHIERDTEKQPL